MSLPLADDDTGKRTFRLGERLDRLENLVRKLSKQIKIYGAIIAVATASLPVYGQIKSAYAEQTIRKIARDEIQMLIREAARANPPTHR
jgi:uncharacterized membrane protein